MDNNSSHPKGVLRNKFYLYLTEFFAGMSVMAVELGASRLLAPYFSSSQIVWTIIIGTIMIAMALGNIYGGRSADKDPDPDKLYRRLLVSAVWTAAIPVLGKFIILLVSGLLVVTVSTNFLVWAAFLACMLIFVFPLFLLGTCTPSLVKYTVGSLDDSGKTVGALGAANTIGSIIGTFVPTFLSIPAFGTAVTFLIFSGIMLILAAVYFISVKRKIVATIVSAALFVVCCIFGTTAGFAFWEKDLTYEGESVYNYLQVKEDDRRVILSTNVLFGVQSLKMKHGGLSGLYYDYAMAAPLMTDKPSGEGCDILVLGMGSGTYATQCSEYIKDVTVEGVEIDDRITDLAREYFDLPESVKVTTYDGRAFLNVSDRKYDVIMVDAYQDITIPFQMSSIEFFRLVRQHLTDDGVMVVNMNMKSDRAGSVNDKLTDTICAVFPNVYTVDVKGSTNRELFASASDEMTKRLTANTEKLTDDQFAYMMGLVTEGLTECKANGAPLTDDKAPVELLGMQVIDDLISEELSYYKKKIAKEGILSLIA
ncbi:Spermidine synthase [Ruminococcus sp. YE71]|uniref:spermidine synthase n=1 Tax=unclassified Ruminococcus TaxID=2608920 RepID=UPI00088D7B8C|nr:MULTISPECIES: fused MFS/spermidine synthase [unclassified Ruminococcus]SDA09555.1 Spermidine synthase [Ruminococcus sp. YE78]SFW11993.1 Spermidine synthase [Ruminococcus sp. YE71]